MEKSISSLPFFPRLRMKIRARFPSQAQLNSFIADLQADLFDISTAGVFTLTLTAFVLAYLFARLPGWTGIGEFAGYYIMLNAVLLLRFVLSRARNAWTMDELGHQLTALDKFVKDELLPRIS